MKCGCCTRVINYLFPTEVKKAEPASAESSVQNVAQDVLGKPVVAVAAGGNRVQLPPKVRRPQPNAPDVSGAAAALPQETDNGLRKRKKPLYNLTLPPPSAHLALGGSPEKAGS